MIIFTERKQNDETSTNLSVKQDDFGFYMVKFLFWDGDAPLASS